MKRKYYHFILAVSAAVFMALTIMQASFAGVFSTVTAFPFEQIGLGLRALSLSGGAGNTAALTVYILLCLLPVAVFLYLRRRRSLFGEDGFLLLLSPVLFFVLYFMINPAGTFGAVGKAVHGCAVYSVLCGYLVLRALRLFNNSDTGKLERYMSALLGVLGVMLVYAAFGSRLSALISAITALRESNTGNEHNLAGTNIILCLGYLADVIPYILDIAVVLSALRLLGVLQSDRYSEKSVAAAEKMSRLCSLALSLTIFLSVAYNFVQLIFIKSLYNVNITVSIPVFSIAFALAALLLTRFVTENKGLKDENDAFV